MKAELRRANDGQRGADGFNAPLMLQLGKNSHVAGPTKRRYCIDSF
jgi:hypothetical protein